VSNRSASLKKKRVRILFEEGGLEVERGKRCIHSKHERSGIKRTNTGLTGGTELSESELRGGTPSAPRVAKKGAGVRNHQARARSLKHRIIIRGKIGERKSRRARWFGDWNSNW